MVTAENKSEPSSLPLRGRNVLFVTAEYPSRGTAGYHSYNRAILAALLRQGARVHLLSLFPRYKRMVDPLGDLPQRHKLTIQAPGLVRTGQAMRVVSPAAIAAHLFRRLVRACSGSGVKRIGTFISDRQQQAVGHLLARISPDCVVLDTIFCAPAIQRLGDVPSMIVTHDIFSDRVSGLRDAGLLPVPPVTAQEEAGWLQQACGLIAISHADATVLHALANQVPATVFPPPLPGGQAPEPSAHGPLKVFYMGSGAHHNLQALTWFLSGVWPVVRRQHPAAELVVAGEIGQVMGHAPSAPGVRWLGRVEDPASAAAGCVLAVDPVQVGGGVKLKILSYIGLGLPCLTTASGAQGLEAYRDCVVVADGQEGFARALTMLLGDRTELQRRRAGALLQAQQHVDRTELAEQALAQAMLALMPQRK